MFGVAVKNQIMLIVLFSIVSNIALAMHGPSLRMTPVKSQLLKEYYSSLLGKEITYRDKSFPKFGLTAINLYYLALADQQYKGLDEVFVIYDGDSKCNVDIQDDNVINANRVNMKYLLEGLNKLGIDEAAVSQELAIIEEISENKLSLVEQAQDNLGDLFVGMVQVIMLQSPFKCSHNPKLKPRGGTILR